LITRRYLFRNPHPMNFNRRFIDGRRVFGDNKSVEGFMSGVIAGLSIGIVYTFFTGLNTWIAYGLLSGSGAMLGDLLNSFIKRRLGLL